MQVHHSLNETTIQHPSVALALHSSTHPSLHDNSYRLAKIIRSLTVFFTLMMSMLVLQSIFIREF